jgi:flagellar hook-length control protein FliK
MMPASVSTLLPAAPQAGTPAPGPAGADDSGAFGRELQRVTDAAADAGHAAPDDAAQDAAPTADTTERPATGKAGKRSVAATRTDRLLLPGGRTDTTPANAARADAPRDPTEWPGETADASSEGGDAPATADLSAWMASLLGAPAAGGPDRAANASSGPTPTGGRKPVGALPAEAAPAARALPAASSDAAAGWVDGARASQGARSRAAATDDKQAVGDAPTAGTTVRNDTPAAARAALLAEPATGRDTSASAPTGASTVGALPFTLNPAGPAAPTAAPPVEAALAVALNSPEFAPAVGAQIARFARDGIEHARLQLNPAEMGPIAVQVAVDGQQVRVDLIADIAATRQALEQSLPALAGALRDAGFTLSGGGVFQQARDGANAGDPRGAQPTPANGALRGAEATGRATEPARAARTQGLVDLFA